MDYPKWAYSVSGFLAIVAFLIFLSADRSSPIESIREWQTLIGASLAFVGAYLTVGKIREQLTQAEDHRLDENARRHNAARVALPLALSEVSAFVQNIADNVATEIESYDPQSAAEPREVLVRKGFNVEPLPTVEIPDGVIPSFQAFVETLSDESEIRHVAELLSSIQILSSRYHSLDFNQVAMEMTLYNRLLDAAKVGFLNDRLFNYGRYLEDGSFAVVEILSREEAWGSILGKAQGLLFYRSQPDRFFGELKKRTDDYKKRGTSPWLEKMEQ